MSVIATPSTTYISSSNDILEGISAAFCNGVTQKNILDKCKALNKSFGEVFPTNSQEWQKNLFNVVKFIEHEWPDIKKKAQEQDKNCGSFYLSKKVFKDLPYSCVSTPDKVIILVKHAVYRGANKVVEAIIDYKTGAIEDVRLRSRHHEDAKSMWKTEIEVCKKIAKVDQEKTGDLEGVFIPTLLDLKKIRYVSCLPFNLPFLPNIVQIFFKKIKLDSYKTHIFAKKCDVNLFNFMSSKQLSEQNRNRFAYLIIQAVKNFHFSTNYAHCDLKPGNFLIQDNKLKLIDFGLSHVRDLQTMKSPASLGYGPPEYYRPGLNDPRAIDAWQLGVLLLTLEFSTRPSFSTFQSDCEYVSKKYEDKFLELVKKFHEDYKDSNSPIIVVALELLKVDPSKRMSIPQALNRFSEMYSPTTSPSASQTNLEENPLAKAKDDKQSITIRLPFNIRLYNIIFDIKNFFPCFR